jgi:hypothetical protein
LKPPQLVGAAFPKASQRLDSDSSHLNETLHSNILYEIILGIVTFSLTLSRVFA